MNWVIPRGPTLFRDSEKHTNRYYYSQITSKMDVSVDKKAIAFLVGTYSFLFTCLGWLLNGPT